MARDTVYSRDSVRLSFRGVSVSVGDKQLLKDVYGSVEPGQLMAIMGPSGGGKTTLLNTLVGRMPLDSGEVTLNGVPLNKQLRRMICYVMQQDAFFPNLTLLETLTFTAMLRLPDSMSKKDKLDKLDALIDSLELRKCLNTAMGGMWCPGLSGGEMKRASIACELITDPTIILLDEPTSGLDYKTASGLIGMLKAYACVHHKTVVATIHQPSSQMFSQFHLLLLLCQGHSVFYGSGEDVTSFFAFAGYQMAPHYNPADFILEKLKESEETQKKIIEASYKTRHVEAASASKYSSDGNQREKNVGSRSNHRWNTLRWNDTGSSEPNDNAHSSLLDPDSKPEVESKKWPTGFITQYKHLTMRAFRESKSRVLNKFKIFETAFLCILLSLIWFQLPRSEDTLRDRMGLIFYISMHWGFTPLFDAVTSFPVEKTVIMKERLSGWYRLSAYYLAKMTSELPLILVQPLIFLSIVYWVTGLNNVQAFFATIGTIFVHSITGQSIGLCLGIYAMDMRRGISTATAMILFIMLIGGFYTRHLPFWLDWAKYLAFLHYTFHCLMFLEFHNGEDIQCAKITSTAQSHFASCQQANSSMPMSVPPSEVLKYYGINLPFWQYFLPLFAFLLFFRVLGYLLLRFYQKPHL